jgi:hypothetical protein
MSKDAAQQKSFSALLNESFEQAKTEYQTGQPVVFSTGNISNLFLPPPNEVMKLFGISNPMLFGIEVAEQDLNLPLDIKSSSRHKLTTSGVGLPSAKKMFRWSRELFSRVVTKGAIFNEQDFVQSAQVNSNALGWYSLLNNSEEMQRANISVDFNEFQPLLTFLRKRCKADVERFEHIRQRVDEQGIESMTFADKLQLQSPLWLEHSDIENSMWETFSSLLLQHEQEPITDKESGLLFFKYLAKLQLDFYLEAIAHYEVGAVLSTITDKDFVMSIKGALTRGILLFANGKANNCFDGYLNELKRVIGVHIEPISWRKLAHNIDVEEDIKACSGDSCKEKQYSRLKKWRKGEGSISDEKLQLFILNTVGKDEAGNWFVHFSYAKIALALDKLLGDIAKSFKSKKHSSDEFNTIFQEILVQYPDYYFRCMARELEKGGCK